MGINAPVAAVVTPVAAPPFDAPFRSTQTFGARPLYYKQFGFAGHEGIDLVPSSSPVVVAVEDGVVVRDADDSNDARARAYGNYVAVENKKTARRWYYAHLAFNVVSVGQLVRRGEVLGSMGASGNATMPHLHLSVRELDARGNAQNPKNGYGGFVDPLPLLELLQDAVSHP